MRRIVEYTVVIASTEGKISEDVQKKIAEGWQPFGGVATSAHADAKAGVYFGMLAQALVKYADEDAG